MWIIDEAMAKMQRQLDIELMSGTVRRQS